ncbi:MAG: PLDc N-terminal domain-containing protein [Phycisphaeraceae bacterium JB051]
MSESTVLNLITFALFINWVYQLHVIFKLREAYFKQPTDRVLWFLLVLLLPILGAVIFAIWNISRAKEVRQDMEHQKLQQRIAERLANPPTNETT